MVQITPIKTLCHTNDSICTSVDAFLLRSKNCFVLCNCSMHISTICTKWNARVKQYCGFQFSVNTSDLKLAAMFLTLLWNMPWNAKYLY